MRVLSWIVLVGSVLTCAVLSSTPALAWTLPSRTSWPLDRLQIVGSFDRPEHPWSAGHRGVDLAGSTGQPVRAAAAGTITVARRIAGRGVMVVDHGSVRTTYEPVDPLVIEGSHVDAGDVIGRLGDGGHCSRRCLHWGLRAGEEYLDPLLLAPSGAGGRVRLLADGLAGEARRRAQQRAVELRQETAVAMAAYAVAQGPRGRGDFRHPVPGPVTSGFGMRFHPILHVWKLHDGTDFGAACGTPILAAASGRVTKVGRSRGYGNRLLIDHGQVDGRRTVTGYNHARRYVVRAGARVRAGQLIGYVGATGYATGCHLHLMLWRGGRLTNPMTWFSP